MTAKKQDKEVSPDEKRVVLTTFILVFPSLILAGIAAASTSIGFAATALALWFYQAIIIQNYVRSNILQ
ncbi:MAG: hypothetical protein ACP5D2_03490 [Candidatus Nanoarchaeia archaeon]